MSVNVSPHQFMAVGFTQSVAVILEKACMEPARLILAVTERVVVHDDARALVALSDLERLGVKLALDDFRTGYSSLGYLETLPVDTIKIDQTFIAKLALTPSRQTIVASIIQLVHGLGMTVVAEGVETADQHHILIQLGADACQGFHFGGRCQVAMLKP